MIKRSYIDGKLVDEQVTYEGNRPSQRNLNEVNKTITYAAPIQSDNASRIIRRSFNNVEQPLTQTTYVQPS